MAQSAPLKSTTILIVENEAIVRMELAIDLLNRHQDIRVLLTDVTMPGSMDGVRLAHHVRNRWPPIKIVLTSGRPETTLGDFPRGSTFFPKPYDADTLRHVLQSVLGWTGAAFDGPTRVAR
jgi:CheY-like chemotaxis protein